MVKVTKLDPVEQEEFFQEHQFDDRLRGVDPNVYLRRKFKGKNLDGGNADFVERTATFGRNKGLAKLKKTRIKKAEAQLEGHENKEAILKILRSE
jgi:hypothetical protein